MPVFCFTTTYQILPVPSLRTHSERRSLSVFPIDVFTEAEDFLRMFLLPPPPPSPPDHFIVSLISPLACCSIVYSTRSSVALPQSRAKKSIDFIKSHSRNSAISSSYYNRELLSVRAPATTEKLYNWPVIVVVVVVIGYSEPTDHDTNYSVITSLINGDHVDVPWPECAEIEAKISSSFGAFSLVAVLFFCFLSLFFNC